MKSNLTQRGLELNCSDLKAKFGSIGFKKLLNKFKIRFKSPIGTFFIEKKYYSIDGNTLLLPRFCTMKLIENDIIPIPMNNLSEGNNIETELLAIPTHNQNVICDHIMNSYYNEENKKMGLCGVTAFVLAGGGKTFIAMNLIHLLKKKTLVIVPNTYLLNQWHDILSEFMPQNTIGKYYGKEKYDGDIVIGIINSLAMDTITFSIGRGKKKQTFVYDSMDYFKQFGFIILDESHLYCTDAFKVIYNKLQSQYMLGLSATPNERDNKLDIISHYNIGEVMKADELMNYKKADTKFNANVKIVKYNGPDEFTENKINEKTNMICIPFMIEDLINDPYRNRLIILSILELAKKNINVFIFSERRNHLEHLYYLYTNELGDCYSKDDTLFEEDSIVLYGNSSNENIEEAKERSKIIFTTYAYSSTGVSITRMTGLILATPRRSKSIQIIGRIFRLDKEFNEHERHIIDIVDNRSIFKTQLYSRMSTYKERECKFNHKLINYSEIEL